jgi:hypothetical protein
MAAMAPSGVTVRVRVRARARVRVRVGLDGGDGALRSDEAYEGARLAAPTAAAHEEDLLDLAVVLGGRGQGG